MRKWSTLFCALTAVALAPVALAQSLDEQARATRDAQRLDSAQRDFQSGNARNDERSARRQRQRDALQKTNALLDARRNNNQTLQQRVRLLDDDLAQLQAVTESTLQSQRRRLQLGPLAADRMDMIEQIDRLAEQPPSLATLYATWFSLHEEWLAGGQVTHLQQALTQSNGVRQTVPMTRFGAIALAYDGRRVLVTPDAGLLVGPLDAQAGTGIDYFLQQVYDSGAIGVALLLCALAAVVIIVRRRGFRLLSLIASASLLLGLLGTVVGLIHTFRALARYGGADASLAAAGIS
ncbi:MAG: MotA/TolQ/ExbB proton channel family protein, partial [Gammaproteobacteria bacterium]